MKLVTVSVAPPGAPAVTVITMSASFSSKIILSTTAVTLTGKSNGNVICQNDFHPVAPSTLADSMTSAGNACNPASIKTMMNGIDTQASMDMMLNRAIQGSEKKEGSSQPSLRASIAPGPNRVSNIDLPIIPLTATGLSINGNRKTT